MNNVILVGRLVDDLKVSTTETGKTVTTATIAVSRSYKNSDGIYETDFIRCVLWNGIANSAAEYCKVGDVIGVKGRLQTSNYEDENNEKHYITQVIADKITFLSKAKAKTVESPEEEKETVSEKANDNKKKKDKK